MAGAQAQEIIQTTASAGCGQLAVQAAGLSGAQGPRGLFRHAQRVPAVVSAVDGAGGRGGHGGDVFGEVNQGKWLKNYTISVYWIVMKTLIALYLFIAMPLLVQAEIVEGSTVQHADSVATIQQREELSREWSDNTKQDRVVNGQDNFYLQQRKHISFLPVGCFLGRGKATSAFVGGWDFPIEFDLSRGTSALLNYRYSLTEHWDIIYDLRTWRSYDQGMRGYKFQQYNIYLTGIGIGFRYYIASVDRKVRPYIQGIINDQIENWHLIGFDISGSDLGIGGAVSVGTEIRINQFFSFPIEYFYLVGKKPKAFGFVESIESWQDTSSLSGQGISVGLSYNWPGKANKYINQVKGNTAR
jgi:hypothetical protein